MRSRGLGELRVNKAKECRGSRRIEQRRNKGRSSS